MPTSRPLLLPPPLLTCTRHIPPCSPPQVWLRFPASTSCDHNELWGAFLPAVQPLVPRMALEAAAQK